MRARRTGAVVLGAVLISGTAPAIAAAPPDAISVAHEIGRTPDGKTRYLLNVTAKRVSKIRVRITSYSTDLRQCSLGNSKPIGRTRFLRFKPTEDHANVWFYATTSRAARAGFKGNSRVWDVRMKGPGGQQSEQITSLGGC